MLADGTVTVLGRLLDSSNATMLAVVSAPEPLEPTPSGPQPPTVQAIYKPVSGERPLADFPPGTLAGREWAAYRLDVALGWDLVQPTVLRTDLPAGTGSLQLWLEADETTSVDVFEPTGVPDGWEPVIQAESEDGAPLVVAHRVDDRLRRLALFDIIANNADRKGSHILHAPGGRTIGIDHGLTFNADEKLRTILWGFAGLPLSADESDALKHLDAQWDAFAGELSAVLDDDEINAARARLAGVLSEGCFPAPPTSRYALPWPPL
nr:SCO1664 family protein [Spelaeicoccus albus]